MGRRWRSLPTDLTPMPEDLKSAAVDQFKYEAQLEDGIVIAKSDRIEFTVGEGLFCPALTKAVKTMKKGEKALITVKPQYKFGEKSKPASDGVGAVSDEIHHLHVGKYNLLRSEK